MSVSFAPIAAWPVVVIVSLALAWLVLGVYRSRLAAQPAKIRIALTTLRMAMWLVLSLAMLRPAVQWTEPDDRPRILAVAADQSRSMTIADAVDGMPRRDALLQLIDQNSDLLASDDRFQVRLYEFSDSLKTVEKLGSAAEGEWTDLRATIEGLSDQLRGERVLATVLLTDGANRIANRSVAQPADAAQQFAEQTGASVHSVIFGSSDLSAGGVDLAVESISVDPMAFVKKTVPIQAKIRLSGYAGRSARVRVLLEDRTGIGDDEVGELKPLPITANATPMTEITSDSGDVVIPVDLSLVAEEAGEFKLRVEVESGDGEAQLANNSRDTLLTVRKNGLKVAYFDTARWERRFLGRINKTARIQLDYVFVPNVESLGRIVAARDWFAPNEYDVFLIGDLPPEAFQTGSEFAVGLLSRVRSGAGLGLICGEKLLGGRPPSFLNDVLPVTWQGRKPRTSEQGFQLTPTPAGLGSFVLRGVADEWGELPPLERVFDVRPRNQTIPVLAETPAGEPLLIAAETGRGRTAVLATADTWMWFTAGNPNIHQRFWQQLLLWLGRKDDDTEKPIWVSVEPRTIDQGRMLEIAYGARDADGNPRTDAAFKLSVTKPSRDAVELNTGTGESPVSVFEDTADAGDYRVTVTTNTDDGAEISASTRFLVNRRDAELDSPAADPAQLEQIAAASGGQTMAPEAFRAWLSDIIKASAESDVVKSTSIPLWDGWPLLLVFVVLLATEWTVRRLRGMV